MGGNQHGTVPVGLRRQLAGTFRSHVPGLVFPRATKPVFGLPSEPPETRSRASCLG